MACPWTGFALFIYLLISPKIRTTVKCTAGMSTRVSLAAASLKDVGNSKRIRDSAMVGYLESQSPSSNDCGRLVPALQNLKIRKMR